MTNYFQSARNFTIAGGNFGTQYFSTNTDSLLNRLNHVSTAGIDTSNDDQCMPGTRVALLEELHHWSTDITAPRIFWLDDMAGTGKSAVARSMCRFLRQHSFFGGSFFCSRNDESRANVRRILPTLAWDLARRDSIYREALLDVLETEPDVADYTIERQVHHLLDVIFSNEGRPPPIFIVDALDECADPKDARRLLDALISILPQAPVKFFITSRPEPYIRSRFKNPQSSAHRILRLHDIEEDIVKGDISLYFTTRLTAVRFSSDPDMFPNDWPTQRDITTLTRLAGKLFIYAFTAIQYIEECNHIERLETLTKFTVNDDGEELFRGPLDEIYIHVLSAALDPKICRKDEIHRTKRILGIILAIREPLVLSDLARLIGITPSNIRINLDRIHAVIRLPPLGQDGVVSTFHKSFVDFLITPGRAPENQLISLSAGHHDLASRCVEIMRSNLYFNMFQCETSYLPNSKQQLVSIPESLRYSCHHWSHHLSAADDLRTLLRLLEDFLLPKFLFWLEVLSATATGAAASLASNLIMRALKVVEPHLDISPYLVLFLHDAHEFIITFRPIIETSIPHIYLSALPWLRQTSKVAETLKRLFPNTVVIAVQGVERQRRLLLDLRGHTSPVNSVIFLPGGSRIVSGSDDGTIKIWDAMTGEEVMNPFNLALNSATRLPSYVTLLRSVRLSPDGKRIAFCSEDKHIRVLDISMGEDIIELFSICHDKPCVASVAFSPDGKWIVSGSRDDRVRVWDLERVKMTLTFKVDSLKMAAFTPCGNRIASCSDHGFQMCDAETGECIWLQKFVSPHCFALSPDGMQAVIGMMDGKLWLLNLMEEGSVMKEFEGQADLISSNPWNCVAFAPNGTWVVSSNATDTTMRVTDIKMGKEIVEPLHSMALSIDFSPDGSRIVTGLADNTVCVWDARTMVDKETKLASAFKSSRVRISPDARYIVACSGDTLAVVDSTTGQEIVNIYIGRTWRHDSVHISRNLLIASGLDGGNVKLWNAMTGRMVRTLGENGHRQIDCVGFSPDGTRIFGALFGGVIYLWDARSGKEVMKFSDVLPRRCANFSPDGSSLVAAGGPISLWNIKTGKRVLTQDGFISQDNFISFICFSPDGGRIISGLQTIQVWDVGTGKEIMTIRDLRASRLRSMCLSPDGQYIVTGSKFGEVQVWDAKTGEAIFKEIGHTYSEFVTSIAAPQDISKSRIVSCSSDKTIRVWDLKLVEKSGAKLPGDSGEHSDFLDIVLHFEDDNGRHMTTLNPRLISHRPRYDGWIIGPNGQLILWVPPEYRSYLTLPPCVLVIGESQVTFDFSRFVHGSRWTECNEYS